MQFHMYPSSLSRGQACYVNIGHGLNGSTIFSAKVTSVFMTLASTRTPSKQCCGTVVRNRSK